MSSGTIGLAARTDAELLRYGSAALFLLLLAAWLTVAVRTVHGGARGRLFRPAGRRAAAGVGRPDRGSDAATVSTRGRRPAHAPAAGSHPNPFGTNQTVIPNECLPGLQRPGRAPGRGGRRAR